MYVKQMQIVNVGPFAEFSVDLTRGSIGIFGANGSGKSTLVNLMYSLITNDFSRFSGVKTDMIRNTADDKSQSFIRGLVVHAGTTLEITRNFKPSKTKPGVVLTINGNTITDTNKAQAAIYTALGVDPHMLDLYVFKEQRRIYDFLTTTPAERAKAYQVLCRTEVCEDLWNMLGMFLNKDREINVEVLDNSDDLATAITTLQDEIGSLQLLMDVEHDKLIVKQKIQARYEEYVRNADKVADLTRELRTESKNLLETAEFAETFLKQHNEAKDILAKLTARYEKRKGMLEGVTEIVQKAKRKAVVDKRRQALERELASLESDIKGSTVPKAPEDADKLDKLQLELARAETAWESATTTLSAFADTGRSECPICHTPVEQIEEHLADARRQATTLPGVIKKLKIKIENIERYRCELAGDTTWRTGIVAEINGIKKTLNSLEVFTPDKYTEAEAVEWLRKFEDLKADYELAKSAVSGTQLHYTESESRRRHTQQRIDQITSHLKDIHVPEDKLEKAKRRLAEHAEATKVIAGYQGEMKGLRRQLLDKRDSFKQLQARLKRTGKLQQMAKIIASARDVLHRDRLPKRVAHANIVRMESDINEYLDFFGNPYWVETSEDLSFLVHKSGEPPQAAGRLSTGQQVVLAMAFWSSVASLWGSELGMLVLDEPTANLDADNRKMLRDALAAMTTRVRGSQQLIMVTHDPDLKNAFDQVITL